MNILGFSNYRQNTRYREVKDNEVDFIVNATFNEAKYIMREWDEHVKWWSDVSSGLSLYCGTFGDMPVYATIWFYLVDGYVVAFYEGTSMVVHYKMIEDKVKETFGIHDMYTKWADSSNFHNIYRVIKELGEKKL